MKNKIYQVCLWISTIILILVLLSLMPSKVPVHWDTNGNTQMGSKYFMIIIYLLPLLIYYGMEFTKKIDPKRKKLEMNKKNYEMLKIIVSGFFVVIEVFVTYMIFNPHLKIQSAILLIVGLLLVLLGNYIPRVPQNYMLGIKTPWGYDNEVVWNKTQRVGGYSFVVIGILLMFSIFLPETMAMILLIALLVIDIIGVTIYSYLVYKKETSVK
ncbi:MAG: SdpI family protein [Thomasclavelia sp.]|nr:SdpI family protein [Thomasclavelia sp.]